MAIQYYVKYNVFIYFTIIHTHGHIMIVLIILFFYTINQSKIVMTHVACHISRTCLKVYPDFTCAVKQ